MFTKQSIFNLKNRHTFLVLVNQQGNNLQKLTQQTSLCTHCGKHKHINSQCQTIIFSSLINDLNSYEIQVQFKTMLIFLSR